MSVGAGELKTELCGSCSCVDIRSYDRQGWNEYMLLEGLDDVKKVRF